MSAVPCSGSDRAPAGAALRAEEPPAGDAVKGADELRQGLAELDAIGAGADYARYVALEPTLAAVRVAIDALGLPVDRGTVIAPHEAPSVAELCRRLGARSRRVVLESDWPEHDAGPLVARWRDDDGERRAAALVFRRGAYHLVDPRTGQALRVTRALAERVEPMVDMVYPTLGERVRDLRGLAAFLLPSVRPELGELLLAGVGIGSLGALAPLATAVLLDALVPGREAALVVQVGLGLLLAAALAALMRVARAFALLRVAGRSGARLHAAVWDRLLRLPPAFFKRFTAGDLEQRVAGLEQVREALLGGALAMVVTAVVSAFYLAVLFVLDTRLGLLALALAAPLCLAGLLVGLAQLRRLRQAAALDGRLSGLVFQTLQGIVKLRAAGAEARAFARWARSYAEERRALLGVRNLANHFSAASGAYDLLALAVVFLAVATLPGSVASAGVVIAFLAAYGVFRQAVLDVTDAAIGLLAVLPQLERARPVLEAEPEDQANRPRPGRLSGALTVSHVDFAYGGDGPLVLRDLSFTVSPGEHVAIVGTSGAGKSTLLRLLLGFERPLAGSISYDGQNLAHLDLHAVRRQLGVVLQHGRLFAGTIFENIRGAGGASLEACEAAADAAGLSADLASFPMGLHTVLTEGATTLSGGQRQRILIARALAAKPAMLFFDEATSALDNRTQATVAASLEALPITRLVIAHRLSTIERADRILVLDRGRLVEEGSYRQLLAGGGAFQRLAARQLTTRGRETHDA